MRLQLSADELDALTELANLGVGRAAANLSRMVAEPVLLSVPRVELVRLRDASCLLPGDVDFVAVGQTFTGEYSGRALLIFPETRSLELVRAVVGRELPLDEIVDLEQEALTEIGNVILNGYLATMANMLKRNLSMSLPTLMRGDRTRILSSPTDGAEDHALLLSIDFQLQTRNISGYIALLLDLPSLASLRLMLGEFVARVGERG